MSLHAIQREFRDWLHAEHRTIASRLRGDAAAGLRVHQANYRAQLAACLEESFARTRDWIGGEAFRAAIVTHADRVPPSSWTLDAYPRDFPDTLAILYPHDREVGELAWIDRALGEAFVAPDAPVIDAAAAAAAQVDWDRAVLHFTPTLNFHPIRTNAPALWTALAGGEVPPPVEILPDAGAVMVWRDHFTARFRAIERDEQTALLHARGGLGFARLCADLTLAYGETEGIRRAGTWLGRWLADGLIAGIDDATRGGRARFRLS